MQACTGWVGGDRADGTRVAHHHALFTPLTCTANGWLTSDAGIPGGSVQLRKQQGCGPGGEGTGEQRLGNLVEVTGDGAGGC